MREPDPDKRRRRTLIAALGVIASVPLSRIVRAASSNLPHLSEDDPAAKALQYHLDATRAKRTDKPGAPANTQFCHNCKLVQSASGDWRPCQIFPGKAVNANGWCLSWLKKSG